MAKNTKTVERVLTEVARQAANRYEKRHGSLKIVLSAAVLAFDELSAYQREYYLAKASGEEVEPLSVSEEEFRRKVLGILKDAQKIPGTSKRGQRASRAKSG